MDIYSYNLHDLKNKLPKRKNDSYKGTYGKVLVIAGSRNMAGAAYLSAKAAYRTGAGLVYIYTEECNRIILQTLLPEAVLYTYDPDSWHKEEFIAILEDKNAVAAGPGLGTSLVKEQIISTLLSEYKGKLILDADGLNILSKHPEWMENCHNPFIITPHLGEMKRLSGGNFIPERKKYPEFAKNFSEKYGVITVLKDYQTVVSDGKECYVNLSGNHGMATGGSGDVLSGIIGGLLAQELDVFEAAKLGVYIHGLAGDRAMEQRGAYSMMASDIADSILYGVS
ncbi:MAG: NAD(P)H-hydrate dehydratase [Muricoprocola sp.]